MNQHMDNFDRGHLLTKIIRGLHSALDEDIRKRVATVPVTPAGFRILWALFYYDKMIMSDLSFLLQLNISSISRQLVNLEKERLISIGGATDARKKPIKLTEDGKKLIETIIAEDGSSPKYRILDELDTISREDFETFIHVGIKLCDSLLGSKYLASDSKMLFYPKKYSNK